MQIDKNPMQADRIIPKYSGSTSIPYMTPVSETAYFSVPATIQSVATEGQAGNPVALFEGSLMRMGNFLQISFKDIVFTGVRPEDTHIRTGAFTTLPHFTPIIPVDVEQRWVVLQQDAANLVKSVPVKLVFVGGLPTLTIAIQTSTSITIKNSVLLYSYLCSTEKL